MSLSVALLLSDIAEVKEISAVFRKLDIIPHYYEDLNSFWNGTLEKMPALCIIDVKCMSEGQLILRNHPLIQTEEMPVLFYYTEHTEPLLFSTYDLFSLGTLKKTTSYEGPLKSVLKRINKMMSIERENLNNKLLQKSHLEKMEQLELKTENLQKVDTYQKMTTEIILEMENLRGEVDFFAAIEKIFSKVDEILEFSILELSFNSQKLISPISHSKKFRMIPSLWLGQACPNGIEVFAQNMASQVAMELMGGELVSLLVKGSKLQPDLIIFIKSREEVFFNSFDWNLFESFISGLFASYELKIKKQLTEDNKFTSSFQAMSFLDQYVFGKTANEYALTNSNQNVDYRLINVDLSSLLDIIHKKGSQRFYWNKFYQEFINKLEVQTRVEFKFFSYGVNSISFLIDANSLDYFFNELKDFTNKFYYWKYFENTDGVLALEVKPKVTMVPLSSLAFLKAVRSEHTAVELLNKGDAQKKTREIIWGREPINEI